MSKRKPPRERIFYRAPRKWDLWKGEWLWTAPGLVISILVFGWSVAFIKIFGG